MSEEKEKKRPPQTDPRLLVRRLVHEYLNYHGCKTARLPLSARAPFSVLSPLAEGFIYALRAKRGAAAARFAKERLATAPIRLQAEEQPTWAAALESPDFVTWTLLALAERF